MSESSSHPDKHCPTPRTDKVAQEVLALSSITAGRQRLVEHGEQLERELDEAKDTIAHLASAAAVERGAIFLGYPVSAPSSTRPKDTPEDAAWSERYHALAAAVDRLYFAAYWHADRAVDEARLWTAVRDYAGIAPGQTAKVLGEDRSAVSATRCIDDLPLTCEAVGGVLDMRIGEKVLAFATENCPDLWDAENDRGRYRVTDAAVFAKAVAHELNKESEGGSTPLSRLLDEVVEEAINQGAEGVEENNSPDGGNERKS